MKRFFRSESFRILVTVAVVVFLGVVCAAFSHNSSSPLGSAMSVVFSPLQKLSASVTKELKGLSSSFVSSSVYREQVKQLEEQLAEERAKSADYEELKQRVEAYEKYYDVKKENPDFKFAYGSVISRDSADAYGSFVLDIGSKDGVAADDPVIYGEYVIGIVKKVNLSTCVVYSVLDPRVNIGAFEAGTREYGYVTGDALLFKDGLCKLSGLDGATSIVSGGTVCTSGAGGVFPGGLIIGNVTSVKEEDVGIGSYAEVRPFADYSALTDLFVITSFEGQGESDLAE